MSQKCPGGLGEFRLVCCELRTDLGCPGLHYSKNLVFPRAAVTPVREKLFSLQILRFLAAFMVFFSHIEDRYENWEQKYHLVVPRLGLDGQLGVDIFFVISGFVMGYVTFDKFGTMGASRKFIADRVSKVVPLYWALTLLQCAVFIASSHLGGHLNLERLNLGELLKSLSFIPYFNVEGKHRPLLGQGWTLDFEMAFYAVVAASLFLRRSWAIAAITGTFVLVWFLGNVLRVPLFGVRAQPVAEVRQDAAENSRRDHRHHRDNCRTHSFPGEGSVTLDQCPCRACDRQPLRADPQSAAQGYRAAHIGAAGRQLLQSLPVAQHGPAGGGRAVARHLRSGGNLGLCAGHDRHGPGGGTYMLSDGGTAEHEMAAGSPAVMRLDDCAPEARRCRCRCDN